MAADAPAMNLGILRFDRTAALIDGRVRLDQVNVVNVPGGKAGVTGLLSGALDAADVPLIKYVYWKQQGRKMTAIPVFTDRLFQHQYMYTRADSGISEIADLRGRKVICAPSFFSTPTFWFRALLLDAGIALEEIEWYSAGAAEEGMEFPAALAVKVAPASWLGLERLLDGTADCLLTARTARVPAEWDGRIRRVCADAYARDRAWAERTGFHPILHVIAINDQALAQRPSLARELCQGFDAAKAFCYRILQDERMTGLPFMRAYLDDTVAFFGDDPWPYGAQRNRAQLERFLDLAHAQGAIKRRIGFDELFHPSVADHAFTAKMAPGMITGIMDGGWAPIPTV
jgi:4,5-dihydroxyphthalate decarboxylase